MSKALVNTVKPIVLKIEQIYLDPNNPRFLSPDWEYISKDKVTYDNIQQNTLEIMVRNYGIDKLAANIRINGFLKIDRIVVQKLPTIEENLEKFIVLEGNRRISAVKLIHQQLKTNSNIDEEVLSSIKEIECLEYIGTDDDAAWIFQGLRHISGITDWPPFNKAKLLVDQMESEGLNLTQVGERFGISPYSAGQWMRGYRAYEQASKESDYIQELDMRIYPYLQEIFGKSSIAIREWLDWDDKEMEFKNKLNLNEFIGWLYPKEDENTDAFGNWDKRYLDGRDDLRTISYLIKQAPQYFDEFRRELDLESAYSKALASKQQSTITDSTAQTFIAISNCIQALNNVPAKALKETITKEKLVESCKELITVLKDLIPESLDNAVI